MNIFFTHYKILFLSLIVSLLVACGGGAGNNGALENNAESAAGSLVDQEIFMDEGNVNVSSLIFTFLAQKTGVIKYESYDIDAVAKSDYQKIAGSMNVVKGESYSLTLIVFADTRIEADEKVGVLLTDINNNTLATFIGTIVNDDFPVVTVSSLSITEGNIGNQLLKFTITLSEETVAPFTVAVFTVDKEGVGFAEPTTDYTPVDFDIIFYAGQLSKIVEVEIFGDAEIEPDEIVFLSARYGLVTTEPVAGVIRTDDLPGSGAPTFEINRGRSLQVAENSADIVYQMPFSINDDGGFTESFLLNYYLVEYRNSGSGNTTELAKINVDFETSLGQIRITPGQIDYVADFKILDDLSLENVEILEFIIANDSGVEFGSARIYISDNETPTFNIYRKYNNQSGVEVSSADLTYAESSAALGEHNIYIEMSAPVGYDYDFEYILRLPNNGEALSSVNSDDFINAVASTEIESKALTILNGAISPAGSIAYAIDFKINDDVLVEAHESFFIELRNSNGTLIGDAVEVKIINDDMPELTWQANNVDSLIADVARFRESVPLGSNGDLGLSLSIDNGFGLGASALEDFALIIKRSVVSNGSCGWLGDSELSNEELLITNSGRQVFSASSTRFNLNATSIDDDSVECDEYVELSATLSSQVVGINSSKTQTLKLVSVNDDQAFLDVYGFEASEVEGTTNFQIKLNADISLEADLSITSLDAEVADASFTLASVAINLNSVGVSVINFQEGVDDSNQVIDVNLTNDSIVELSESYTLNVSLGASAGLPIGLRYCQFGLMPECTAVAASVTDVSVSGIVHSDDELVLTIAAKTSSSVLESDLTALNLIDGTVQYPYQVLISNEVASDVPSIELAVSDKCLIVAASDCANSNDFEISNTFVHIQGSQTNAGSIDLGFKLLGNDDVVEPNEVSKLAISLNNSLSLQSYVSNWSDEDISYSILNDDKLTFTFFNASTAGAFEQNSGNQTSGISVSWDKEIGSNIPTINLLLSETCDELNNSLCVVTNTVTGSIEGDIYAPLNVDIHIFGTNTLSTIVPLDLGVNVVGDAAIEPDEIVQLTVALENKDLFAAVLSSSWVNWLTDFTIYNDDTFMPTIDFTSVAGVSVGNVISASGSESVSNIGITLGWTEDIASNVTDIEFVIESICVSEYSVGSSYSNKDCDSLNLADISHDTRYQLSNKSSGEVANLNFLVFDNDVVEPNELVTLTIGLGSTPSHYFTDVSAFPSLKYHIVNDDVLGISFSGQGGAISEGDTRNTNLGVLASWTNDIAVNVPPITLSISEVCDNVSNSHCIADAGDLSIPASIVIHGGVTATAAGTQDFNVEAIGDLVVEPNELVELAINYNDAAFLSDYLVTNTISNIGLTVNNDDVISPVFTFGNLTSVASAAETHTGSDAVGVKLSWGSQVIADNTDDLSFVISDSCVSNNPANTSCENSDYNFTSTYTLINQPSLGTAILTFNVVGDEVVEPSETVNLGLAKAASTPSHYFPSTGYVFPSISYTIINDDKIAPYFTAATSSGNEGSVNADAGVKIGWDQVIAANVPSLAVIVSSSCAVNGCAVTEDFNFSASESVSVFTTGVNKAAPGAAGESLGLIITGDAMVEPSEDVTLTLSSSDTDYVEFAVTPSHTRTITNDDKVVPYFIGTAAALDEGAAGQASANVKFTWDQVIAANVPNLDVSVNSACAVGGCTLAQDINYGATQALSIFTTGTEKSSPGVTGHNVGLSILGDVLVEPSEIVSVTLSSAAGAYIDTSAIPSFDFTITNDDKVAPYFVAPSSIVLEGDVATTDAPVKVTWDQDIAANASSLSITIGAVCASGGCDVATDTNFSSTQSLLVFTTGSDLASPGATGIDIGLTLNADEVVEPDEVLTLTLTPTATAYIAVGSGQTHGLTIDNDDKIAPYFTAATSSGNEGSVNADAGVKIGWDQVIAANVPSLAVIVSSTCAVNGCAVTEDFNFAASETVSVFTTGADKAAPGGAGESLGLIITGDAMVEPSEDVTLTLSSSDTDYVEFAVTPSHTRTINNDDTLSISVADVSVLESGTANITFVWSETVAKNVPAFDIAIAMACNDLSATSTCNMAGFDDFTAQTTVSLRANGETSAIPGGNVLLNVPLVNDSSVEPTEIIDVGFTIPGAIQPYFTATTIPNINVSIENDDLVDISYVVAGTTEADGKVSLTWGNYRVEGFANIGFQLDTGVSSNVAAAVASATDYSIGGALCSAAGVCLLSITAENLAATSAQTITFNSDDIIEPDEEFSIGLIASGGSAPISTPLSASSNITINNDDLLAFSLDYGTHTSGGSIVAAGPSIMIAENALADQDGKRLNLIACNASSTDMEGGDLIMDVSYSTQAHQLPVTSDRFTNASIADDILTSVSSVTVTGTSGCHAYPLITQFTADDVVEAHEWFSIEVAPVSSDVRCINSAQCMGGGTSLDDDGLVVIANDDFDAFAGSGNDQCLDISGSLVTFDGIACDPAGQDVEVVRNTLSFVPLTSAGYPTLEQEHACISDASTGYVWARYGLSAASIPEVSAAEVNWAWSGGVNDAATKATVNQLLCGKADWLMPELDDLVRISDLDWLNSTTKPFNHNATTSMIYWASQACYVDGDGATAGHYAYEYQTGTSLCLADTSELHIRMLAK
jgi:hypothetical protein